MNSYLRPFWTRIFKQGWLFGILLILLFGIPRFIMVLQTNLDGNFSSISILFILMAISPFVFLRRDGRKSIGMLKPRSLMWLFLSFLLGILGATLLYFLGKLLFNGTISNWFVSISQTYLLQTGDITPENKLVYFIIFAIIGMTFSPIGEEILYRGIIHRSFSISLGGKKASVVDNTAFGVTHLAHFGLVYNSGSWKLMVIPAMLWVILIFITGLLFNWCRIKTGSLLGAIFCHAGFNLGMNYFIFYHII
jgi:membrane protease YdiL (CAAX protease family)